MPTGTDGLRQKSTPPSVSVRLLREAHGLTLPALARRIEEGSGLNVSADHLSNCELGWKRPSNALLHAWAKALAISPLDINVPVAVAEQVPA